MPALYNYQNGKLLMFVLYHGHLIPLHLYNAKYISKGIAGSPLELTL